MRIQIKGETVRVSGVQNLEGEQAMRLRAELKTALKTPCHAVEVDLSYTKSMDSTGLGVLLMAWLECGRVRLLNAPDLVRQFLDLTRQRQKFELTQV